MNEGSVKNPDNRWPDATVGSSPSPLAAAAPSIPDHTLVRRIGAGSYGEVWLARSIAGSYRAVKIVKRSFFCDDRPFEREFRGLKRFEPISRTHPGFINILHIGSNENSGYFYCIMEIADDVKSGQTIRAATYQPRTLGTDLARRGRLPLDECLEIGLNLASALADLHRHSLVHRDIKPSNIIFVRNAPKLADIGLVTAASEATTTLGTRGYIPPENTGSPAADLFSLGKVLYQISTGKSPEQFPELPTETCDLGGGPRFVQFNEVLLKACENNPQKRYESAMVMRAALNRCLRTIPATLLDTVERFETNDRASMGGERKLVTVLLVSVTRLARTDPEKVQGFTRACLDVIRAVLQRFGGAPPRNLSDAILALFGAPVASEDHALRAAHASLALRDAFESKRQELETRCGCGFEVRCSLNTGLTILSRGGSDEVPTGDVIEIASRLLGLTEGGQITLTETLRKAVEDHFDLRCLGERQLHPKAVPLKWYEIMRSRPPRTRLEAGLERGLTPFVGRNKELALLRERLADARAGRGQVALVAGEPGTGKSRLLLEFQRSLSAENVCWLAGRSISFGSQMAYLPVIDLVKRIFRIGEAEAPATVRSRIEDAAREMGGEARPALAFIKYLLAADPEDEAVAEMDAQQRRVKTFEALQNLILERARQCPVVLAIEDLHWADRTSEDFLVSTADSLSMAPILMVLSYRPEYHNSFPERSFITRLTLQRLSNEESLEMAGQILGTSHLPQLLRTLVVEKAEGNPFFVEEMIKSLIETGALHQSDGTCEVSENAPEPDVPDTIQDVIMSRIDRLEDAPRQVLQLASVIGREFPVGLLETLADLNEPLSESLRTLKCLELIYERSRFPEHTCFFKHALTQEVAYHGLLLQRRKELHRLVAASIEELYAGRLPEFFPLLAYHYERGEEWERALDYLQRAAGRSRSVGAHGEEAVLLTQAITIAQQLGQPATVSELRVQRGIAWIKSGKWKQSRPDLESALLETPPGNLGRRAELLSSLSAACYWGLDVPAMRHYAGEGYRLVEKNADQGLSGDLAAALIAWQGTSCQVQGDLPRATELFQRALAKGSGFCSAAFANYPLTLYWQGHNAKSLELATESARTFRSLSDTFAATFGHPHLGLALAACGRYSEAARVFDEAMSFGRKHEIWTFHARAAAMSAGFHLDVYDFKGNEKLAEEAREHARSAAFQPSLVSADLDLAFNFVRRGDIGRAENMTGEAAAAAATVGGWHQWLWQVRLRQASAEIACARHDWSMALGCANSAISESRSRGRKKYLVMGLETRAKTLEGLGRKREAIDDLRQAIELVRPMGDPALFLRVATTLLAADGDDALLLEARETARRIVAQLPEAEMRRQFLAAEPVRALRCPD
jgi:class 3 adenylate cyclase/tetratricopeptide (TPR) repeat protein